MRSPPRPSSVPRSRRQRANADASAGLSIEQLERRFAKFRRDHPPQTRIPDTLRGAVLAAMRHGVTPSQLRRCCGLSSTQLEQWQQGRGKTPANADLAARVPRVFSVVGDSPAQDRGPAQAEAEDQLELRLGGWSICVRRVDW